MRLRIKKDNGIERLYIEKSVRINSQKVSTVNVEKLGRLDKLMESMGLSRDEVVAWAQNRVNELNEAAAPVLLSLSPSQRITLGECRSFHKQTSKKLQKILKYRNLYSFLNFSTVKDGFILHPLFIHKDFCGKIYYAPRSGVESPSQLWAKGPT